MDRLEVKAILMPQPAEVTRREFLTTLSAGAAGLAAASVVGMNGPDTRADVTANQLPKRVKRKFAPHLGMFRNLAGDDLVDQIRFMAEQGFTAIEDNGFARRPLLERRRINEALAEFGMRISQLIGSADFGRPTFASSVAGVGGSLRRSRGRTLRALYRANAVGIILVPGQRLSQISDDEQTSKVVQRLEWYVDGFERSGLCVYLEPLNHLGSRPQMFLHSVDQAAEICRAVGSDACKILFDVYHQSAIGTDVFDSIERNWDQIGYFQIGDFPGRKEPGTGTFDFKRFFAMTDSLGYTGYFGMEHGNSMPGREGELAVLEAYRKLETIV